MLCVHALFGPSDMTKLPVLRRWMTGTSEYLMALVSWSHSAKARRWMLALDWLSRAGLVTLSLRKTLCESRGKCPRTEHSRYVLPCAVL